jgi:hypothetical protein
MNVYTKDELERINKVKETNDKMEDFFNQKRQKWNENIEPLFQIMKTNFTLENSQKIIEIQSLALSYRQNINEEISYFLNKRSKEDVKLKSLKQEKFIFYATGVGLKTNMGEKNLLIDAHIGENERNIQLIDTHIEFLRSTSKNLEALGFTVKNIIELMNYLGK